ncbi:hypothetical protein [Methylobacterium dankookense]|jgi:hypothetical protein|uniref:Uncharacterized protein n=1 Tax=Methylobacterium dankookense TaxID=560405 RepID=A0A564G183_9HYPH|nr:hypothetical protein [Methylobacterium dankookense]GJD57682.1 hypothetical protein IFDJLNFL_3594 [Methylobacterium dankookense]VUF13776.1 hypothetical protein MTDSW087_03483 [Methylobacterium dankookense]
MFMYCCIAIEVEGRMRLITATSEREAALAAEAVLRRHSSEVLSLGYAVECENRAAGERIADYLADVAFELTH